MKPNQSFLNAPPEFWANVRIISQEVGYTNRLSKTVLIPTITQIKDAFFKLNLSTDHIVNNTGKLTPFGCNLFRYFEYRANILDNFVQNNLMDKDEAEDLFYQLYNQKEYPVRCPLPMNKQTGNKKGYAFFTCIINLLIDRYIRGACCDYDPRGLTAVTMNGQPLRTLSRRVDGAYPSIFNPVAIWEIKEYYYTTTFGSRVADGVYETLLDGMEINELEKIGYTRINHVLFIDSKYTWWHCGRSYLCRIVDMLHMGYVDEVVFGKEVIERLPSLVVEWQELECNKLI